MSTVCPHQTPRGKEYVATQEQSALHGFNNHNAQYASARPLILKRTTTNPKMDYEDYYTASNDV